MPEMYRIDLMEHIRPPRVSITYPDFDPSNGKLVPRELPFVFGVLGAFSGKSARDNVPFAQRAFVDIDASNFDEVLNQIAPHLSFDVVMQFDYTDDSMRVDLTFNSLRDFEPESIVRQVDLLNRFFEMYLALKSRALSLGKFPSEEVRRQIESYLLQSGTALLSRYQVRSADDRDTIDVERLLKDLSDQIYEIMAKQLREIMHAPAFRELEATWRGLNYFVRNTDSSRQLSVRILDATREQLREDFRNAPAFEQSLLYQRLIVDISDPENEDPFCAIIGDYEFGCEAEDIDLLNSIALVAERAHTPFIAGASPSMFDLQEFTRLNGAPELADQFASTKYSAWREFRRSAPANFVTLCLPRMLARPPYDQNGTSGSFSIREVVPSIGEFHGQCVWTSAAYALGTVIARAASRYGWCGAIEGPEQAEVMLPYVISEDRIYTTETPLTLRREEELKQFGFTSLASRSGSDRAAFMSVCSVAEQRAYDGPWKTNRLGHILIASRFAHYLDRMLGIKRNGAAQSASRLEQVLNQWLLEYVVDMDNPQDTVKIQRPLRAGRVTFSQSPELPGAFQVLLDITPHYMVSPVATRLTTRFPLVRMDA